jgi:hypothetical protein
MFFESFCGATAKTLLPRYDGVLSDPSREDLGQALEEAVRAANEQRRQRSVNWPLPELEAALNESAGLAQGWRTARLWRASPRASSRPDLRAHHGQAPSGQTSQET